MSSSSCLYSNGFAHVFDFRRSQYVRVGELDFVLTDTHHDRTPTVIYMFAVVLLHHNITDEYHHFLKLDDATQSAVMPRIGCLSVRLRR